MATERIEIIVTESGTDVVVKKIEGLGTTSKKSADSVDILKGALAALGAAATISGLVSLLDTYQTAANRLTFVSKSQEEATSTMSRLLEIANRSRTSFEQTVNVYSRIALATENMGISHEQAARLVETLNKAVILSGSTTREATNSMIQFTQGLAAGTLRGRELRSLMQELPAVADIIAERLGVTRGALRQMGTEGKVSADLMVKALLDASTKIDDAFAKTSPRIQDQLTVLKNNLIKFVIDLNDKFQIIPRVVAVLDFFAEHMDTIGRVVLAGIFVVAVYEAIAAVTALTAAIAANPIGVIAVLILAGVAAIALFADKIHLSTGSIATLGDFAKAVFEELVTDAKYLGTIIKEVLDKITPYFKKVFGDDFSFSIFGMLNFAAKASDSLVGLFSGAKAAIAEAFKNLPLTIEAIFVAMINKTNELIEGMINSIIFAINKLLDSSLGKKLGLAPLESLQLGRLAITKEAADQGKAVANAFKTGFESQHDAQDLLGRLTVRATEIAKDRIQKQNEKEEALKRGQSQFQAPGEKDPNLKTLDQVAIDEVIRKLQEEAASLKEVGVQRRVLADYIRIEQQLRNKGIQITEEEKKQITNQLMLNEQLKIRAKLTEEVDGKLQENAIAQKALNDIIKTGTGNLALYVVKLNELKIEQLNANRDLVSGFKAGFLEMQDTMGDFAKQGSHVVTDAFAGMENAVISFVKTGKLNFSQLVDSILADLLKIVMNQAILSVLGAISGAGGGGGLGGVLAGLASGVGTGSVGGARAEGGSVSPGKAYLVGERGPELFNPGVGGSITPNHAMGGAKPNVHVHVVNVTDPNEIAASLNHPEAQDVIVNVLRRNKTAVRSALGV